MEKYIIPVEIEPNSWIVGFSSNFPQCLIPHISKTQVESYDILFARLSGLTYGDFYRLCRDKYHGVAIGKKRKFFTCRFADKVNAQAICDVLNDRFAKVIQHRKIIGYDD